MRAAAWNLWTSNRIDPNPNGIDCYHEQGQVLKTAGASNPDARVGTQSSAECSDTKKDQDFLSYKGLAFGNNLSPSRIGTRRKPLCLSTRARYHLSKSFPNLSQASMTSPIKAVQAQCDAKLCQVVPSCAKLCQVVPSCAKLCQVVPSCAKWLKFCFSALLRASASGKAAAWTTVRCPMCLTTWAALANQYKVNAQILSNFKCPGMSKPEVQNPCRLMDHANANSHGACPALCWTSWNFWMSRAMALEPRHVDVKWC